MQSSLYARVVVLAGSLLSLARVSRIVCAHSLPAAGVILDELFMPQ